MAWLACGQGNASLLLPFAASAPSRICTLMRMSWPSPPCPTTRYPTVCREEKPVVLHADVRSGLPLAPGKIERRDYALASFEFHCMPKHGSWHNQAEIEISIFERGRLSRPVPDIQTV